MYKMFNENDADTSLLENNQIAVLGYGRQGKAQALNLRESGANVTLGLRAGGKSWIQAEQDGWQPETVQDAVKKSRCHCLSDTGYDTGKIISGTGERLSKTRCDTAFFTRL